MQVFLVIIVTEGSPRALGYIDSCSHFWKFVTRL